MPLGWNIRLTLCGIDACKCDGRSLQGSEVGPRVQFVRAIFSGETK